MMEKVFNKLVQTKRRIVRRILLKKLRIESHFRAIAAKRHPEIIHIDKPYEHQKILLIALYEKTKLRPDIQRLLKSAKTLGYFVVGCNTEKLEKSENLSDFFDLYIERFNFGRDFGSYKTAFLEIFKREYHLSCPRLLMLNDSVYYESTRTPKFLQDLMNSEIEVVGATENHHLRHHLGSFCISYSNRILKHPAFIQYWHQYVNSDVRPIVIEAGEKDLTACLKRIISEPTSIQALYDVNHLSKLVASSSYYSNLAFQLTCRSGTHLRLYAKDTWMTFLGQYYFIDALPKSDPINLYDFDAYISFLRTEWGITDPMLEYKAKTFIHSRVFHAFANNSQIHTNAVLLMHLGLPLVKLDGYFRGAFSSENVLELCDLMQPDEANELKQLLFSRPFGTENLPHTEYLMFECGFI